MAYTGEQREYLSELYDLSRNSRTRAAEMFYGKFHQIISPQSISNYWKEDGFRRNSRGGYRHGLTDSQFADLHAHFSGDADLIAEMSGFMLSSIITRCNKMSLPYTRKPKERLDSWSIDPDMIQSGGIRKSRAR